VQLSQATGRGKSMLIASNLMMLGGIILVVEPLLAVGADQVDSLRKLLPHRSIIHLDDHVQGSDDEKEILDLFQSLPTKKPKILDPDGVVIFTSPQRLTNESVFKCVQSMILSENLQ